MDTNFYERYAALSDDELLHIAGDRKDLIEEAALALDAVMVRRGLTHEHTRAKKRDELRFDLEEARTHQPKLGKSRYLAARLDLRVYFIGLFIGLAGFVLSMFLSQSHRRVVDEWSWPLFVVYGSAPIAYSAVQPWVKRTFDFWLCLAISSVPQFVVARWLAVYHPSQSSAGGKGSAFLSMLAGYLLGGTVFLLLQKFRPGPGTKVTT